MNHSSYPFAVFEASKQKQNNTLGWTLFLCVMITFLAGVYLYFDSKYLLVFLIVLFVELCLWGYLLFRNTRRLNFKKGQFIGDIIFKEESIQIGQTHIHHSKIKFIRIRNSDFTYKYQKENWLQPYLSIGVNNLLYIEETNGETHHIFFQQKFDNELMRIEHLLQLYVEKKLLSADNLRQITTSPFI